MTSIEDMARIIAEARELAASLPPRRTLRCHPSVMAALMLAAPAPEPSFCDPGRIGSLTGIEVHEDPEMIPGCWEIREGKKVVSFGVLRSAQPSLWPPPVPFRPESRHVRLFLRHHGLRNQPGAGSRDMNVTRNGSVRITARQGTITVTSDAIVVPWTGRALGTYARSVTLRGFARTLTRADVREVSVGGRDRQYMTGKRAAGVVLTGGAALLAPSRIRGTLVISTTAGDVFEFTLKRGEAKHAEAIAAAFSSRGYSVR